MSSYSDYFNTWVCKKLKLLIRYWILFFCLTACTAFANDSYLLSVEKQFESLLEKLQDKEQKEWRKKASIETMKCFNKSEELTQVRDYILSQPDSENLAEILSFSYSADYMQYTLQSKTKLTNDLGTFVIKSFMTSQIEPVTKAIEIELVSLQNANGALTLQNKLSNFLSLQRLITKKFLHPPILESYEYRPMENAWDDKPALKGKFILYDWINLLDFMNKKLIQLQGIKDSFVSFNYLRLKDPIAFVSLGCQLAILLVTVAGYIITYTKEPSIKVITSLVGLSMITSIGLIFLSSNTTINLIVQAIVPGGFILYWICKKPQQIVDRGR